MFLSVKLARGKSKKKEIKKPGLLKPGDYVFNVAGYLILHSVLIENATLEVGRSSFVIGIKDKADDRTNIKFALLN